MTSAKQDIGRKAGQFEIYFGNKDGVNIQIA